MELRTLDIVDGPMTSDLVLQNPHGRDNEYLFGMFGRTQPHLSSNHVATFLHENFPRSFAESWIKVTKLKRRMFLSHSGRRFGA